MTISPISAISGDYLIEPNRKSPDGTEGLEPCSPVLRTHLYPISTRVYLQGKTMEISIMRIPRTPQNSINMPPKVWRPRRPTGHLIHPLVSLLKLICVPLTSRFSSDTMRSFKSQASQAVRTIRVGNLRPVLDIMGLSALRSSRGHKPKIRSRRKSSGDCEDSAPGRKRFSKSLRLKVTTTSARPIGAAAMAGIKQGRCGVV